VKSWQYTSFFWQEISSIFLFVLSIAGDGEELAAIEKVKYLDLLTKNLIKTSFSFVPPLLLKIHPFFY
jgi:hypothetical protein